MRMLKKYPTSFMREMHTESTADATAHRLTAAAASLTGDKC